MNISSEIRASFPSLDREYKGKKIIYMDGPGGTQVPEQVIQSISTYYENSNANTHGFFPTSKDTDGVIQTARERMAEFLGAENPDTISFGQNMTSLNYSLSKALLRTLNPGDEILITQLDHEANRGPWLTLRENGIKVNEVGLLSQGVLDYDDFESKFNEKTRIVALGYASNAFGTINDIEFARNLSRKYGSLLIIDAVHFAPHFSIDVSALDCDFLLCSAYKFYGPHVGILYSREGLLDQLQTDCLITQNQSAPYKIETGTLNHAALAGVTAAVDFIAAWGTGDNKRLQLKEAMTNLAHYENMLGSQLYNGLKSIEGVEVVGPDFSTKRRAPTVSIKVRGSDPGDLCRYLGDSGICAWDGHFYARRAIEVLGLLKEGGVTRFGISAYTTEEEVETVVETVKKFVAVN